MYRCKKGQKRPGESRGYAAAARLRPRRGEPNITAGPLPITQGGEITHTPKSSEEKRGRTIPWWLLEQGWRVREIIGGIDEVMG